MTKQKATGIFHIQDANRNQLAKDPGNYPLEYYDQAAAQIEANRKTTYTGRHHVVVRSEKGPKKL